MGNRKIIFWLLVYVFGRLGHSFRAILFDFSIFPVNVARFVDEWYILDKDFNCSQWRYKWIFVYFKLWPMPFWNRF